MKEEEENKARNISNKKKNVSKSGIENGEGRI